MENYRQHKVNNYPTSMKPSIIRAYPDSEFVAANTLAKWKKLEPSEINFSQGFSQKVVSTSCFVFISLPASGDFCCLLITFANSFDTDQAWQNVGPDLDQNCLTPWWYWKKSSIQRVKYGTIKKQYWKIQKLTKIYFFANMYLDCVLLANDLYL